MLINFNPFDILLIDLLSDTLVTVSDKEEVTTNNDNICNEIVNGVQDVIKVTCNYKNRNPPVRGRYVTIRRKDDAINRHWLNFCEVELLSCPPGRWGYNSDNSREDCSHPDGNPCDQTDGLCLHGKYLYYVFGRNRGFSLCF